MMLRLFRKGIFSRRLYPTTLLLLQKLPSKMVFYYSTPIRLEDDHEDFDFLYDSLSSHTTIIHNKHNVFLNVASCCEKNELLDRPRSRTPIVGTRKFTNRPRAKTTYRS